MKIRKEFPTLIAPLMAEQIKEMGSYSSFHGRSFGDPLSFTEGEIHISITNEMPDCLFAAWDFVKEFLRINSDYKARMEPKKIILSCL
jgi:hypothetical protein